MKTHKRILPALKESYAYFRHKSGLRVYYLPKSFPEYFICLGVNYGSFILETPSRVIPDGTAHFMEHMMFHMEDGGDVSDVFAEWGANINACTTNEFTAYFVSGVDSKYDSVRHLVQMVFHPCFSSSDVEKEKMIVGQEIALYKDDPSACIYNRMMSALYKEHPIRRDICGSSATIDTIDSACLQQIHEYYYTPSNMVLVLTGNFQMKRIHTILDAILSSSKTEKPAQILPRTERESMVPVVSHSTQDIANHQFMIGWKDTDFTEGASQTKRGYLGEIVSNAIFARSGELYSILYEKGLCGKDLDCIYEWTQGCAHTLISGTSPNPEECTREILSYLKQCSTHPPDENYFNRARKVIYADTVRLFDSQEELTLAFMEEALDDGDLFDIPRMIADITYNDFTHYIRDVFSKDADAILYLHPIRKGENNI